MEDDPAPPITIEWLNNSGYPLNLYPHHRRTSCHYTQQNLSAALLSFTIINDNLDR